MDDIVLPEYLHMVRKTFEFGNTTYINCIVDKLSKEFISVIDDHDISSRHFALEKYWALEHACYVTYCKMSRKKYSEFLPGRVYTYELVKELIKNHMNNNCTILEAGCGSGICCALLAKLGYNVTGVDIAQCAVDFSKDIISEYQVSAKIGRYNITDLPFGDNEFDLVYSLGVLEHYPIETQLKIVSEMKRVCRKIVILLIPNRFSPIFQTMVENESTLVDKKYIFPEENFQYSVDLVNLATSNGLTVIESSSLHIAPPKVLPMTFLSPQSFKFFIELIRNAVDEWCGNAIETWRLIEKNCTHEALKQYGWFSYIVTEKL